MITIVCFLPRIHTSFFSEYRGTYTLLVLFWHETHLEKWIIINQLMLISVFGFNTFFSFNETCFRIDIKSLPLQNKTLAFEQNDDFQTNRWLSNKMLPSEQNVGFRTKCCLAKITFSFEQSIGFRKKRLLSNKSLAFEHNVFFRTNHWLSNKTMTF